MRSTAGRAPGAGAVLALALAAGACGDGESVTLVSSIYVNPVSTAPAMLRDPAAVGDGLLPGEILSVTPSSFQLHVDWMVLGEDWEPSEVGPGCTGARIEIPIEQTLDLSSTTFHSVFESTLEVSGDKLGAYRCIQLEIDDRAEVTWQATVNGTSYDFSAPASAQSIGLAWGGRIVALPEGAQLDLTSTEEPGPDGGTVTTTDAYTIGLVVDLNDSLSLRRIDRVVPENTIVEDLSPPGAPNTDAIAIFANAPILLPFAGTAEPVVDAYMLGFADTEKAKFGLDPDDHVALRVDCVLNASGELAAAGWIAQHGTSAAGAPFSFEPAELYLQRITVNDDPAQSYEIEDIHNDQGVRDRALHFPAFQLADHTGVFEYGDSGARVIEYTAARQP